MTPAAKAATLAFRQEAPSCRKDGSVRIFTMSAGAVMTRKNLFVHLELSLSSAQEKHGVSLVAPRRRRRAASSRL
jgi:hypothetical protein